MDKKNMVTRSFWKSVSKYLLCALHLLHERLLMMCVFIKGKVPSVSCSPYICL